MNGLPTNTEAERYTLGAVLHDNSALNEIGQLVSANDFSLTVHQKIYSCMLDMQTDGTSIDRVTLATALMNKGQLQMVGGISRLSELDNGLPDIAHPAAYARTVRDLSVKRRLAVLGQEMTTKACELRFSPAEIITSFASQAASLDGELSKGDHVPSVSDVISDVGVERLLNPNLDRRGIETGFFALDEMTMGLQRKNLVVIAARPSVGKSSLMTNIAVKIAGKQNIPVAIFSLEMSARSLIERMACAEAEVNLLALRSSGTKPETRSALMAAVSKINTLPIYIDDSSGMTHQQVSSKLDRLVRERGVQVAFRDYLQMMGLERGKGSREKNENERIGEITGALKATSKRHDVCMVALSQLSRAPEQRSKDHRPTLSDLRGSGNIEQDADLVAFIYREYLHSKKDEHRDQAELIIGKQRQGPVGTVKLRWDDRFTRFYNA
jgi:replicative DNA helicase